VDGDHDGNQGMTTSIDDPMTAALDARRVVQGAVGVAVHDARDRGLSWGRISAALVLR